MAETDLWPVGSGLQVALGGRKQDTGVPFRVGVLSPEPSLIEPDQLGQVPDQAADGSQPSAGANPN
jgi:hypothetical protein